MEGAIMKTAVQHTGVQAPHHPSRTSRPIGPHYKWIALTNTTMGVLMASIDTSIVLISLPAIFNGIHVNPLAPGETDYFLWILLGYMVVTATLLVTFGRISDMFGRVRLYNMGFAIFSVGSILLWLTPGTGNILHAMSAADRANLLGHGFFPSLISPPFAVGLHAVFYLSAALCLVAALASFLRGKRHIHDQARSEI
jgi:MFS family permease